MNLLLPSLKITGGNIEALKLLDRLEESSDNLSTNKVCVLWRTSNEILVPSPKLIFLSNWRSKIISALSQYPVLLINFYRVNRSLNGAWLFTHYSTLLFSLFVKKDKRFFFIQGLEWEFVQNIFIRYLLKKFIFKIISKGKIITANQYLENVLSENGLSVHGNIAIWADKKYLSLKSVGRPIDCIMVLRTGQIKRLDLYRDFIFKAHLEGGLSLAVITPEDMIFQEFRDLVDYCCLRPSMQEMIDLYSKSKIFIHLSDTEGFGLPPLESMGSGCVPLCRDSGGVRVYMETLEKYGLLLPITFSLDQIFKKFLTLLSNTNDLEFLSKNSISIFKSGFEKDKNEINNYFRGMNG
jgi:glycosyltransferase involved in cell wall biosynthesis